MRIRLSVIVVTLCLLPSPLAMAEGDPPKKTLEAFQKVVTDSDLQGSFLLWAKSRVSKKNGKGATVEETLMRVVNENDKSDTELLSYKKDGKDETEKRKKELEKRKKQLEEKGGDTESPNFSLDFGMRLPSPDNDGLYEFNGSKDENGVTVVEFEPTKVDEDPDTLVKGRLGWDPDTLDPVFIETTPVKNPKFVDELWMRTEFKRAGDRLMMSRNHTKGVGGMLVIKRQFEVEIEIRDYEPPATAASASKANAETKD